MFAVFCLSNFQFLVSCQCEDGLLEFFATGALAGVEAPGPVAPGVLPAAGLFPQRENRVGQGQLPPRQLFW
jgi:hypothetical protein